MLNQINNSDTFSYAMMIPVFSGPELINNNMSEIISYAFPDSSNIYKLNLNDKYNMIVSLNNFFSYDFANHFATFFYRLYTNNYRKILYGPVLIISKEDPDLMPYLLLEEINSLLKSFK